MKTSTVNLTIHGYDATRWIVARQAERRLAAARAFLGIEADKYRVLCLRDRRGERPDLIAYGARRGTEIVVCLDVPGAKPIALPLHRASEVFGDLADERDPDVRHQFGAKGFRFGFRNEFSESVIEPYAPVSEAERARLAEIRRQKKAEREDRKWREEHPLFASAGGVA